MQAGVCCSPRVHITGMNPATFLSRSPAEQIDFLVSRPDSLSHILNRPHEDKPEDILVLPIFQCNISSVTVRIALLSSMNCQVDKVPVFMFFRT